MTVTFLECLLLTLLFATLILLLKVIFPALKRAIEPLFNKKRHFVFNYIKGLPEDIVQYCDENHIDTETWLYHKSNQFRCYNKNNKTFVFYLKNGNVIEGYCFFPKTQHLTQTYKKRLDRIIMVCYDGNLVAIDYEDIIDYLPLGLSWKQFYNIPTRKAPQQPQCLLASNLNSGSTNTLLKH